MGIVFNEKGIEDFETPALVQEYLNHNATIEKVFVVDETVVPVRRPSLPNFHADPLRRTFLSAPPVLRPPIASISYPIAATLMFNSQDFEDILGHPSHYDVVQPSQQILHDISKVLRLFLIDICVLFLIFVVIRQALTEITGLTLFGYDLILNVETNKYAVIDINFFPGFEGFPDFETHFLNILSKRK